jgi:hypothetical protein
MSYISLDALYKIFTPSNVATLRLDELSTAVAKRDVYDIVHRLFLDPNSCFYTYGKIKGEINNHYSATENQSKKEEAGKFFHFIGPEDRIDFRDSAYWDKNPNNTNSNDNCKSLYDIVPSMKSSDYDKQDFVASAYVVRSAYVNPANRGTDKIDMFLNYIPGIVASQMVPYLDVEFKVTGASNTMLNTPGPLRFLMGSSEVNSLSPGDQALKSGDYGVEKKEVTEENGSKKVQETSYSIAGVENFLMPQTLTNMDGLGPTKSRLVRAKPFLPFASILGFDVSIINAGAGKFSHKKGTLKLAIHDKGRLSEISEFIRGASGFNQVLVWTTYGWLAPTNRENDEYIDYINKNMINRECWQIVNTQYSFDASGQVSLALEMVSKGAKLLQEITISEIDAYLREFHKVIQTINKIRSEIETNNSFNISVLSTEILNAGSTTGVFTDVKDKNIQAAIQNLVKSLKKSNLSSEQLNQLDSSLKDLTDKKGKYRHDQVLSQIGRVVKEQFDKLREGLDPFLSYNGADSKYFPDAKLGELIDSNNKNSVRRANSTKKAEADPIATQVKTLKKVVSFGKLFLHFVVPAIAKSHTCNEIQIIFYSLNDSCGPVSNQSVAEFPIDMSVFATAYAEHLKSIGVEDMTLETFMKLVIDSQFSDIRSLGFGMNNFYKPIDKENPGKAEILETKDAEDGMAKWLSDYGSFKPPMIEMYVETGEESESLSKQFMVRDLKRGVHQRTLEEQERNQRLQSKTAEKKIIKRIHIYDKQCNPYGLMQSIINTGDVFELGQVDTGVVKGKLLNVLSNLSNQQKEELKKLQKEKKGTLSSRLASVTGRSAQSIEDDLRSIERPGGVVFQIPRDRDSLKAFIMRNVPTISVGTNGTMVFAANVASKTDSLMGSINIINANKNNAKGKATLSDNGLEEINNLPLRAVPMQVTMTTAGVPTAQLYQTFFLDFNTGTTIDNLYNCTQLQHSITPGKFATNWTFAYTDGYGKFSSPPSAEALRSGQLDAIFQEEEEKAAPRVRKNGKP